MIFDFIVKRRLGDKGDNESGSFSVSTVKGRLLASYGFSLTHESP